MRVKRYHANPFDAITEARSLLANHGHAHGPAERCRECEACERVADLLAHLCDARETLRLVHGEIPRDPDERHAVGNLLSIADHLGRREPWLQGK